MTATFSVQRQPLLRAPGLPNINSWMSHKQFNLVCPSLNACYSSNPFLFHFFHYHQLPETHSQLRPSFPPYPQVHLSSAVDIPKMIAQVPAQVTIMAYLEYSNNFLTGHLHFMLVPISILYIVCSKNNKWAREEWKRKKKRLGLALV